MHDTALENARLFFQTYSRNFPMENTVKVLDLGSQDINGSIRQVCPKQFSYVGIDFVDGKGVDIVLEDAYSLPFPDGSVDIVVSSSCFEHSEFFWLTFLEIQRVLKPNGLFYLNAPSAGHYHRHPVDCWRFFPDSGQALANWSRRNGYRTLLLESFIQDEGEWRDYVAVYLKDSTFLAHLDGERMLLRKNGYVNGTFQGIARILNSTWVEQNDG